jgi:hypothetical protein
MTMMQLDFHEGRAEDSDDSAEASDDSWPDILLGGLLKAKRTIEWPEIHECKLRLVHHENAHVCDLCEDRLPCRIFADHTPYDAPIDPWDSNDVDLKGYEPPIPEPVYYCIDCDFDLCVNCYLFLASRQPKMVSVNNSKDGGGNSANA